MADLVYVTKVMKTILRVEGRSKWMNERSHQFLKFAGMKFDHRVENGGGMSLLLYPENAKRLEEFGCEFLNNSFFSQLDNFKEQAQ